MATSEYLIQEWNERFSGKDPVNVLEFFLDYFTDSIAFSSSMGAEDQVITAMIAGINPKTRIFTLDTGRLFPETYDLIQSTSDRYKMKIEVLFPDAKKVEAMVSESGVNLFYDSIEKRKHCCQIRKMEPLKRVLSGLQAWISGIRKGQSVTRTSIDTVEWDEANSLVKINPLAHWTEEEVWDFIHQKKVPFHPLHTKSFPSIGCQPCTRAILPGEDIRAGRWWWENPDTRECGLHVKG